MPSIAEFTLPADKFPLGRVFETKPDATLELDRVVPSSDTVMPYFWVYDDDGELDAIEAIFAALPELRTAELLVDMGDRGLFRAEWVPDAMGIMEAIAASGVTVLSASGSHDGWLFEIRATEDDQLQEFQQRCRELDIDVTLSRLSRLSETTGESAYSLTSEQVEALRLAYERGYYDDSRTVDQETLADELGITRQAFAARLRRGYRALLEDTICAGR